MSKELLIAGLLFNFQRGNRASATLALDPNKTGLFLIDEFFIELLDLEKCSNQLKKFFETYLACQEIFSATSGVAIESEESNLVSVNDFA